MEWIQVFAPMLGILGIFLWTRAEATADRRETQEILRETHAVLREDRKDFFSLINEMKDEMKDFHYRLLEIEKNRSK